MCRNSYIRSCPPSVQLIPLQCLAPEILANSEATDSHAHLLSSAGSLCSVQIQALGTTVRKFSLGRELISHETHLMSFLSLRNCNLCC